MYCVSVFIILNDCLLYLERSLHFIKPFFLNFVISPSCFAPYMEWSVFPGKAHRFDFSGRHVQTMALGAEVIPSILYCRWVKCQHSSSCLGQVPCFLSLTFALDACVLQANNDFNSPDLTDWIMCIDRKWSAFFQEMLMITLDLSTISVYKKGWVWSSPSGQYQKNVYVYYLMDLRKIQNVTS